MDRLRRDFCQWALSSAMPSGGGGNRRDRLIDGFWPTASGRQEAERVTAILRIAARQYLDGWQAVDDPFPPFDHWRLNCI
jgi:hypothetical protein